MYRIFKFKMYPTLEQKTQIEETFDCCAMIFNLMLQDKIDHFKRTGKYLWNKPTQYKEKYPRLRGVDSLALKNMADELHEAYQYYWDHDNQHEYFPVFKSYDLCRYKTSCVNNNIRVEGNCVQLPKVGRVEINKHREIPSNYKIKSALVCRDILNDYYVHIKFQFDKRVEWIEPVNSVGLAPIKNGICITSDGQLCRFDDNHLYQRLRTERFRLDRCKLGSNNRNKQQVKVDKALKHIENYRHDYLHKLALEIAETYDVVHVAEKNFEMDCAYHRFLSLLNYKLHERGKKLVEVKGVDKSLFGIDLAKALI